MRQIDLYRDRQANGFVQGINSSAPVTLPEIEQGDTLKIVLHNLERNSAVPALTTYIESAWQFDSIRASVGLVDAAPESGTFKLTVGDETSAAIAWPASLATAAEIAEWKATVLAALVAMPSIVEGDIVASDPSDSPGHFLYFTWTDATREDVIGIASNALAPVSVMETKVQRGAPGYQQLLKFVQLPIAITDVFLFPAAPVSVVSEERAGAAGTNAVQLLTIPLEAVGSLSLLWAGSSTRTMAVAALTAPQLATALNAIVVDGTTNPSFRVEARGRGKFAIEFVGPLAGAVRALLGVTNHAQAPLLYAVGRLPLTNPRFERVLNGAASVTLKFELVVDDAGGESTITKPMVLVNDMTNASTTAAVEQADAILVRTETIVVDNSTLDPYVTVSPGLAFIPEASAQSFSVNHGLSTRWPDVRGFYKENTAPEKWRELTLNAEFSTLSTTANDVTISIGAVITSNPAAAGYFGRYKFFISSPDATVQLLAHKHAWSDSLETLPGGQTLTAKLAAIDAALGMIAGALSIPVASLTGLIKAGQIDIDSLVGALGGSSAFLTSLRTLVTDPGLVAALFNALATDASLQATLDTFLKAVIVRLGTLEEFTDLLSTQLTTDPDLGEQLRTLIVTILQTGGALPAGFTPMIIPDFELIAPPFRASPVGSGGTRRDFAPFPRSVPAPTGAGEITGLIPLPNGSKQHYVVADGAYSESPSGGRGEKFADGAHVVSDGALCFAAVPYVNTYYPAIFERSLLEAHVSGALLDVGTQFALAFVVSLALEGDAPGACYVVLEVGEYVENANAGSIASIIWTEVFAQMIRLGPATVLHSFEYTVSRTADVGGEPRLTAKSTRYAKVTTGAVCPESPDFPVRARLTRVDLADAVLAPRGCLTCRVTGARASVAPL